MSRLLYHVLNNIIINTVSSISYPNELLDTTHSPSCGVYGLPFVLHHVPFYHHHPSSTQNNIIIIARLPPTRVRMRPPKRFHIIPHFCASNRTKYCTLFLPCNIARVQSHSHNYCTSAHLYSIHLQLLAFCPYRIFSDTSRGFIETIISLFSLEY